MIKIIYKWIYNKVLEKLISSIENRFNLDENLSRDSYYNDMIIVVEEALTNTILQSNYRSNKVVKITNYKEFFGIY